MSKGGIGLYYFGARYYDREIGRWLVPDPAGQFFSPYAYSGNRPLVYVDRDGRLAWFVPILIGAAINSVFYAATTDHFTWRGLAGAAVSGGISGALAPFAPAGIIPGTLFGAGVGGLANFTGALIGGTDPGSALLWGAAGGFIGGGISGGLQAHALGRNILTGAAPKPIPVPVPLSTPINPGEIRGVGQTAGQELVDATVESPVLGKSWPWRPASELSDIERVQSMLSRTFDPQEAAMLRNHFPYKEGLVPHNSLLKSVDAGGTGRIVTGANATHYRFTQFINRGNNVQIVVMQRVIGTNNWQLIQNVVIPKSLSPIAPSTIYMHGYGVIR